jgi:hypothetical protein
LRDAVDDIGNLGGLELRLVALYAQAAAEKSQRKNFQLTRTGTPWIHLLVSQLSPQTIEVKKEKTMAFSEAILVPLDRS